MCSLECKRVIDWDHLKPQGLGWLLASIPPEKCCFIAAVSLFFCFVLFFPCRDTARTHMAIDNRYQNIQLARKQTKRSNAKLLLDLRPGTRFGAYNKLIHDFISMHAFKLNTLNINGIHSACGNAVLGV